MKKSKFKTQSCALLLVMLMFTIIPNMKVYSAVGNYSSESISLNANDSYVTPGTEVEKIAWLAAAAEAIALAYGAGYVLGTVAHHAYDYLSGEHQTLAYADENYKSDDFSGFDN